MSSAAPRSRPRPRDVLYRLSRSLHLYLGLFLSPLILLFALSAAALALGMVAPQTDRTTITRLIAPPPPALAADGLRLARHVRTALGLSGDIGYVRLEPAAHKVSFPLDRPGERSEVAVDIRSGFAEIGTRPTGFIDALIFLHKKPGPHNVALRGNWAPLTIWAWLADATVYILLLVTCSGIYLWQAVRRERRLGLSALALGFVLLVASVAAMIS